MAQTQDTSEFQQAEKAGPEIEAIFQALAESTPAAIFIFQGPRLHYVNPAAETITGYTKAELLAMNFWEVAHPESQTFVKENGLARLQGQQPPSWLELKILTKTGEERWVSVNLGTIQFKGQTAVIGTAFDITSQRQSADALKRSEATLRAIFDNSADEVYFRI